MISLSRALALTPLVLALGCGGGMIVGGGSTEFTTASDQTLTLPASTAALTVTRGNGIDEDVSWTQLATNPTPGEIEDPTAASTVVRNLSKPGTYVFTVTGRETFLGTEHTAQVTVTVLAAVITNKPPTASAGTKQTLSLPTTAITLAGTATDPDGDTVTVKWTQTSGPAGGNASLATATSLSTKVTGLRQGTYVFTFAVEDGKGGTASSTVDVVVSASAGAGTTTLRSKGSTTAAYGYVEYLPPGYTPTGKVALLIVLHGAGEQGDGTTQLATVRVNGPNKEIDSAGKQFPFVILTPQSGSWWNVDGIDGFLTYALATYGVDAKRVYMTGLSMGGGGTWDYAAKHADRLAAIIPICGATGVPSDATALAVKNKGVAIWASHALNDPTVGPASTQGWFSALGHALGATGSVMDAYPTANTALWETAHFDGATKKWVFLGATNAQDYRDAGGVPYSPPYLVTFYPSGGHGIWGRFYADPRIYDWLQLFARP